MYGGIKTGRQKKHGGRRSMEGIKWRDRETWREYGGGKVAIPAAVFF